MLTHLHIRDFAIIDSLDVNLESGLTSLTGETGAGKSILLDALGLVLGDRANSDSVRQGANKTNIIASFNISALPELQHWLEEHDLEADDECLLRRVISADGRSKAYLNGQPTTLSVLKKVGEQLVNIHGQHEHQHLLKRSVQRRRLDDYGKLADSVTQVAARFYDWQSLKQQLDTRQSGEQDRAERLELLQFQLSELDALSLAEGEWQTLCEEQSRLAHADQLLRSSETALHQLYDGEESPSASSVLSRHASQLEQLTELDNHLGPIAAGLRSAQIQLEEACSDLREYTTHIELDPERLVWLDQRMAQAHGLAKKHRVDVEQLHHHHAQLADELAQLSGGSDSIEALQEQMQNAWQQYLEAAQRLSKQRQQQAEALSHTISEAMQGLGMEGGQFHITVDFDADSPSPQGGDKVEFTVSANPGQPLKPLSKVASGGELSRISLALQMVTAECEPVPTLIFDEVDSGVGGGVAEVVGQQLRALGQHRQVLCVTHLPQVASQANHQLQVSKQKGSDETRTQLFELSSDQRVEEIARMLGGVEITDQSLRHAQEMLERAAR
ncbi:DNA repair protein RecN [gamma proteobacterium HTCC5015]|nr:DNA repair protein RecN [gamma proteobacterium HTCC5015]